MCATFLYTAAMMAVRTRIPTRKHLWKYWCRISDWTSALTNMRTARMYPRYCGICLSFVKCIKALKQIKYVLNRIHVSWSQQKREPYKSINFLFDAKFVTAKHYDPIPKLYYCSCVDVL